VVPYHLDYATVRRHGSQLATERLILTHMGPTMLARLGEVEYDTATDGLVIHLYAVHEPRYLAVGSARGRLAPTDEKPKRDLPVSRN
jgi:hypothetical protein